MTRCISYVLIGAIAAPAAIAAFMCVLVTPLFIAEHVLHVHPAWGLLFLAAVAGALFGGAVCRESRP